SKTASSAAFLDALDPQLALLSSGYHNHFGHPHADVLARLRERSIPLLNTADAGFLHVRFASGGHVARQGRDESRAWWRIR
ncbi:MAG TPA: DNA internalization-related competence protein ComEC/Rec2, partial [Dokdonella sp.]|nr:DNA internalization-related competence protein ComEC/Rec2 [Dokdonella sp.]